MMEGLANAWWPFILLGICAGLLSGTLGIGSGIVLVPALVLLLSLPQQSAQGMSLAVMVPMALAGAVRYKINPEIEMSGLYIGLLVLGAVMGALIGAELAQHLPGNVLRKVFAIFIIVVGIKMLLPALGPWHVSPEGTSSSVQSRVLDQGKENFNVGR